MRAGTQPNLHKTVGWSGEGETGALCTRFYCLIRATDSPTPLHHDSLVDLRITKLFESLLTYGYYQVTKGNACIWGIGGGSAGTESQWPNPVRALDPNTIKNTFITLVLIVGSRTLGPHRSSNSG